MALLQTPSATVADRKAARITPRSIVFGLVISCLASAWVTYSRTAANTSAVNITHLPVAIFAIFLCVFAVNTLLKIRFGRQGLENRELAVIFAMGLIGAIIPARGLTGIWLGLMAAPYYLATRKTGGSTMSNPISRPISFRPMITAKPRFSTRACPLASPSLGKVGSDRFFGGSR